ncbi:MAG: hypothetical protein AAF800_05625 [Planctomycetota bacterium]
MPTIHVFYRLAEQPATQPKIKLPAATKLACLRNFVSHFSDDAVTVLADGVGPGLRADARATGVDVVEVSHGSGGGNFRDAAARAMALPADTMVYLVEDDFVHRAGAREALLDGFDQDAAYVTLYDHPDKYVDASDGGNPHVSRGGEKTLLTRGTACHWKRTNSTVMTFAVRAGRLASDWKFILPTSRATYTDSYTMFRRLARRGRHLISAVPGLATHAETAYLSPGWDWSAELDRAAAPAPAEAVTA